MALVVAAGCGERDREWPSCKDAWNYGYGWQQLATIQGEKANGCEALVAKLMATPTPTPAPPCCCPTPTVACDRAVYRCDS